ncbi:hypothetical protein LTR64_007772 [Lithohypha guttulata]|uniref:uncharacterized protein n=1 Tax=Lithohypha guttulata TaxID=1690604 RepID=UPI002DDFDDF2|nr:hypothetical protein LTR51_007283 [Lithohypha guttulata]
MGRAGPGLFDSDQFWDYSSDLNTYLGFDLPNAGDMTMNDAFEDDPDIPAVLSIECTATALNDGIFTILFDILKTKEDPSYLCLLVINSTRVGARITKGQLNHVKKVHTNAEMWKLLPECRLQIKVACEEYRSGKPYTFKEFDFEERPWENPDDPAYGKPDNNDKCEEKELEMAEVTKKRNKKDIDDGVDDNDAGADATDEKLKFRKKEVEAKELSKQPY